MTFTALTGAVSHLSIAKGEFDYLVLALCIVFTLIFAIVASKIANKLSHRLLNVIVGVVLLTIGIGLTVLEIIRNI